MEGGGESEPWRGVERKKKKAPGQTRASRRGSGENECNVVQSFKARRLGRSSSERRVGGGASLETRVLSARGAPIIIYLFI